MQYEYDIKSSLYFVQEDTNKKCNELIYYIVQFVERGHKWLEIATYLYHKVHINVKTAQNIS